MFKQKLYITRIFCELLGHSGAFSHVDSTNQVQVTAPNKHDVLTSCFDAGSKKSGLLTGTSNRSIVVNNLEFVDQHLRYPVAVHKIRGYQPK